MITFCLLVILFILVWYFVSLRKKNERALSLAWKDYIFRLNQPVWGPGLFDLQDKVCFLCNKHYGYTPHLNSFLTSYAYNKKKGDALGSLNCKEKFYKVISIVSHEKIEDLRQSMPFDLTN